jgi:hypothetical protein
LQRNSHYYIADRLEYRRNDYECKNFHAKCSHGFSA